MSEFEDFISSQGFGGDFQRGCNGQYKSDLLHFMEKAFMHQQTKIDELEKELSTTKQVLHNVIDMERAKIDDQQKLIDKYGNLITSIRNEFNLWADDGEFSDAIEAQIENFEILRGENDQSN